MCTNLANELGHHTLHHNMGQVTAPLWAHKVMTLVHLVGGVRWCHEKQQTYKLTQIK